MIEQRQADRRYSQNGDRLVRIVVRSERLVRLVILFLLAKESD